MGRNGGAWGEENDDGSTCTFGVLVRLVADVQGIDRIRFTTSHPIEVSDDIIEVYSDTPELVSYLPQLV
ncbi:hypothetical protein [Salmonella enterica]|uniref:hypothetical protein n=1 Tax=Salmonella enterica TaxID=28901 RepID=UPI00398C3C8F